MNDYLDTLKQSFSKDSFLASLFFFFILSSWYTLRPLRNELAVQDIDNAKAKYKFVLKHYPNNSVSALVLQILENME